MYHKLKCAIIIRYRMVYNIQNGKAVRYENNRFNDKKNPARRLFTSVAWNTLKRAEVAFKKTEDNLNKQP